MYSGSEQLKQSGQIFFFVSPKGIITTDSDWHMTSNSERYQLLAGYYSYKEEFIIYFCKYCLD